MILLTLSVLILLYFFYKKISMDESVRAFAKAVPGPPLMPIIGNLTTFLSTELRFSELLQNNWEKYGNRFRLIAVNRPILVTSDIKDIEVILANTTHKADLYYFIKSFLGNALIVNPADIAKKKRRIFVPTFHAEVLSNYFSILEKCIKKFMEKTENVKDTLNIADLGQLFTLDVLSETAMGVVVNAMDNAESDYVVAFKGLLDCWDLRWRNILYQSDFFYFNFSKVGKSETKIIAILEKFCSDIIAERRKIVESDQVFVDGKKISFLDALLVAKDDDGNKLNDEEISHEVRLMLVAGHDTTFATLSFMSYEVAKNPEVQEKIYQEQLEIFGDNHGKIATVEEVQRMKYLDMVVKEALRMYATVPSIGRKATKDIQFDGFILPEGSDIYLNLFNMGRNPEMFPDPMKFNPERFNPNGTECKARSPLASIPFSYGARNCIGQSFAMWEMKSLFSSIVRKYKISPSDEHKLDFVYGLTMKPKDGLYINIQKRNF